MVLIPIRAPILSLCITIVSVVCELAFLTAALSFLRYAACRRLRLNKRVRVRAQHKRVLAVTLFAMLAFVALETVTSIFSDPQTKQTPIVQPCVRNLLGAKVDEDAILSEAIHFACTKIENRTLSHFAGNFSTVSSQSACASTPMYSYTIGENTTLPVQGSFRGCDFQSCAFVTLSENNDTILLSGIHKKTDQKIVYIPTSIDPEDAKLLDLPFIAQSLADVYGKSISEEGEIRRRVLLGSVKGNCTFLRDDGQATTITLGVLIGAGVVWISSLLFFFASLFFRRKIFFDITHPMHWARRARHDMRRANGDDPELELINDNGQMRIRVTGYLPEKEVD